MSKGYEKRAYPSITWACTGMTYEIRREEEGMEISGSTENMMKMVQNMMTKKSWKNKPPSKMFMKLFKYVLVNCFDMFPLGLLQVYWWCE